MLHLSNNRPQSHVMGVMIITIPAYYWKGNSRDLLQSQTSLSSRQAFASGMTLPEEGKSFPVWLCYVFFTCAPSVGIPIHLPPHRF